ncbi:MAG: methyltransferase domain-containing protein [Bdellovibrionales bacterium]|nr:methyltransferase domain-containing protein [Bdellovibrionales bacterium]
MKDTTESVKDYYGKQLKNSSDLKTNACCTDVNYPTQIKTILSQIHDEVLQKYYGCGLTIPNALDGLDVLDLGSGSGRDCFLASKLVGENGSVVGVDMTDEQLDVANRHIDYHKEVFGYNTSNVEFKKGQIEQLKEIGLTNNSFDLIISNCVINLSTNKQKVLQDCYDLLKVGGEMYFSDVYVDRRIEPQLSKDPTIYGECLGGALYYNDFLTFAKNAGFIEPRAVESSLITIENKELEEKLSNYNFYSITYRLFKIPNLEQYNEDYDLTVTYKGTISSTPDIFILDDQHKFQTNKVTRVSSNTYKMLSETRFKDHFEFTGDLKRHNGIFSKCSSNNPFENLNKQTCC